METDVAKLRENLTKLLRMAKGIHQMEQGHWRGETRTGAPLQIEIKSVTSTTVVGEVLGQIGDEGKCKACGETIWWIVMAKSGKRNPIQADAVSHFSSCPEADKFRRGG